MASKETRRKLHAERIAAEQARVEQLAKEHRQQTIISGIVVAIIAILTITICLLVWQPWNKSDESSELTVDQAYEQLQQVETKPETADSKGGILLSKNGLNEPVEDVPTVSVYMDFMCSGCGKFNRTADPTLKKMLDAGQVNIELHPMSFGDRWSSDSYSTRAANMLLYIIDHDKNPDHILDFITNMYDKDFQPEEGSGVKTSDSQMQEQALKAGVSQSVVDASVTDQYTTWLKAIDAYTPKRSELWNTSGNYKGQMTTPTTTINGYYWDMNKAQSTGDDAKEALLASLGISEDKVGIEGELPSIGSEGKPLYDNL